MAHGVFVSEQASGVGSPLIAESGIPFVIGSAPVQSAEAPATVGEPVLCTSWESALRVLGYSDSWENYTLCEFMYSHFKLYGCQPVIFCNVLDPKTMNEAVTAADKPVKDHKIKLPIEAINDTNLVVKPAGGTGTAYTKDTDYVAYYEGEHLIIELLSTGGAYSSTSLNVAYKQVTPDSIDATVIGTGMESIEKCLTKLGEVPDIICAPGFSQDSSVAAVMAEKAAGINGIFKAKALIDIDSSAASGADTVDEAVELKETNNFTDETEIVCWPLLKLGDKIFHMSTHLAGLIAKVDSGNNGCPYESPSNKGFMCDAMVLDSGDEISLTPSEANTLNAAGIVTALNFLSEWRCWGNYTACYPSDAEPKDSFIPVSRMFDWIGNSLVIMFWSKLDKPMSRRLIDSIIDSCNIWLNGLVGAGNLLGARVEFKASENPVEDLSAGIIRVHIYMTPPSPAQEINFVLVYDTNYVRIS